MLIFPFPRIRGLGAGQGPEKAQQDCSISGLGNTQARDWEGGLKVGGGASGQHRAEEEGVCVCILTKQETYTCH